MGRKFMPPERPPAEGPRNGATRRQEPIVPMAHWSSEPERHVFTDVELEIIRRLLEQQDPRGIRRDLGLAIHDWDKLLALPKFQREFELQAQVVDRSVPARVERLSAEAIDVVRDTMRQAISPSNRLRAALEILDRSGYVKVEKRLTITADAESVIRELNKLSSHQPGTAAPARGGPLAIALESPVEPPETSDVPQEAELVPKDAPQMTMPPEEPVDALTQEIRRLALETAITADRAVGQGRTSSRRRARALSQAEGR